MIEIKFWTETKQYLSGKTERLDCELIAKEEYCAILKHTVQAQLQVGNRRIAPGNVDYRFHWPNRTYNLLKYYNTEGELLANYFQLADSYEMAAAEVRWRDLSIAVLVLPDGTTQLITGNDRPALSDTWLHIFIAANTQDLLRKYREIITETDLMLQKYPVGWAI